MRRATFFIYRSSKKMKKWIVIFTLFSCCCQIVWLETDYESIDEEEVLLHQNTKDMDWNKRRRERCLLGNCRSSERKKTSSSSKSFKASRSFSPNFWSSWSSWHSWSSWKSVNEDVSFFFQQRISWKYKTVQLTKL